MSAGARAGDGGVVPRFGHAFGGSVVYVVCLVLESRDRISIGFTYQAVKRKNKRTNEQTRLVLALLACLCYFFLLLAVEWITRGLAALSSSCAYMLDLFSPISFVSLASGSLLGLDSCDCLIA